MHLSPTPSGLGCCPFQGGGSVVIDTSDVRNILLIVLYLYIHVGHDKNQYIHIYTEGL